MPKLNVDETLAKELKRTLSEARYRHVEGVVKTAIELAKVNDVSVRKARTAAWLHDYAREWPRDQLFAVAKSIMLPEGFDGIPPLLHGPIAAHIGKTRYGILEEDILDAVRYHTTGRPGMTQLDLVLFVADAIEPKRYYPGVEEIRDAAKMSLERAARLSIDGTIQFMILASRPLLRLTVDARNALLEAEAQKGL